MESDNDRMMRMIMHAWQTGGEASVREMLGEADVPVAAIDRIIAQIRQAEAEIPATMPLDQIQRLMRNTVAVKTTSPDRLMEWRNQVQSFFDGAAARGDEWLAEREFAQSLLNILDNKPAALPAGHPYEPYLREVLRSIKR